MNWSSDCSCEDGNKSSGAVKLVEFVSVSATVGFSGRQCVWSLLEPLSPVTSVPLPLLFLSDFSVNIFHRSMPY
jgi:hypothetical protein